MTGNTDVLVISVGTTMGLRQADLELARGLRRLGVRTTIVGSSLGLMGLAVGRADLADLTVAAAIRVVTDRAVHRLAPRAIVFPTTLSAALISPRVLARSAVRFDALAAENRPGPTNVLQRSLERRVLGRALLLLPWSLRPRIPPKMEKSVGSRLVSLPTPIRPSGSADARRERTAVFYAGNPMKKGLDIAVEAWRLAGLDGWRLLITGLDPDDGMRFLRKRGVGIPGGTEWLGKLSAATFRGLVRSSRIYLSASRFEDFGAAQLEALADGAILVSLETRGPAEAVPIARDLRQQLVAGDQSPTGLADALREGAAMCATARNAYRSAAAERLVAYSPGVFDARLRDQVLPRLLALSSTGERLGDFRG